MFELGAALTLITTGFIAGVVIDQRKRDTKQRQQVMSFLTQRLRPVQLAEIQRGLGNAPWVRKVVEELCAQGQFRVVFPPNLDPHQDRATQVLYVPMNQMAGRAF